MEEKIRQCFASLGFIINESENDNFQLSDYLVDSLAHISLMVELEQTFDFDMPDEYLVQGRLQTFHDLCNMVEDLTVSNA